MGDIRGIGSGNIGATNVLRTGRKGLAAATLVLDGLKGAAAVLIARALLYDQDTALLAGLAAVLGHLFPIWLRFKGGKGVATGLGVLVAAAWPIGAGRLRRVAAGRGPRARFVAGVAGGLQLCPLRCAWFWKNSASLSFPLPLPCWCSSATRPISAACSPAPNHASAGARRDVPEPARRHSRRRHRRAPPSWQSGPSRSTAFGWFAARASGRSPTAACLIAITHPPRPSTRCRASPGRVGGQGRRRCVSAAEAERELERTSAAGGRMIFLGDEEYPPLLAMMDDAPPCLIVSGDAALAQKRCVAAVGGRNASANGQRMAENLAADLAATVVVVSGLARGIDTAVHTGAMRSGRTIAVIAGGIDQPYPPENADLHRRIAEAHLLISEAPLGTVPQARHFPRRNRIIAGLSLGVVVVEAALRSGSLITVRMAQEVGREVFAVPGSPLDPRARGGNDLIRQGAMLVENAADVLDNLPLEPTARRLA